MVCLLAMVLIFPGLQNWGLRVVLDALGLQLPRFLRHSDYSWPYQPGEDRGDGIPTVGYDDGGWVDLQKTGM